MTLAYISLFHWIAVSDASSVDNVKEVCSKEHREKTMREYIVMNTQEAVHAHHSSLFGTELL